MKSKVCILILSATLAWWPAIQTSSRGQEIQQVGAASHAHARNGGRNAAAKTLRDVRLLSEDGGLTAVIELDGKPEFASFALSGPDRIVIDLKGVRQSARPAVNAGAGQVARVRAGQFKGNTMRVVFDMTGPQPFRVEADGPRLLVRFGDRTTASVQGAQEKPQPAQPAQQSAPLPPPATSPAATEVKPNSEAAARAPTSAEVSAQESHRKSLDEQFKKIGQLIQVGKSAEAAAELDAILKANPSDEYANGGAGDLFIQLGDLVAAEHHLKFALRLARDPNARAAYEAKLEEANSQREKQVKELLDKVSRLVDEMNYAEAAKTIQGADRLALNNPQIDALRGDLLGVYRNYEDAVKIYSRLLEDHALDTAQRAQVTDLRDYCAEHAIASSTAHARAKRCHFCKARLLPKAAYCHVCLSFQHQFDSLKAKGATTSFYYDDTGLRDVSYSYYNMHNAGNAFRSILGGLASAGGNPVSVEIRDTDQVNRHFTFAYDQKAPQSVEFKSSATIGGSTTSVVQSVGGITTTSKESREEATAQAFSLNERLVYANHPQIDAVFALKAFGQNVYRGFAGNWKFGPFSWEEPHIFVLYYDKDQRVSKAVDSYRYGEANAAGHRVVTSRKPFTGPNRIDPLSDPQVYSFKYNEEGLVTTLTLTTGGKESYRREILYGTQGIVEEREHWPDSKKPKLTKYVWNGAKLVSAKHGGAGWPVINALFK